MAGISRRLLRNRVSISRYTERDGGFEYEEVATDVRCSIQPISDQEISQEGETLASEFFCYMNLRLDMSVADRLVDENNNRYKVQGIEHHGYAIRRHTKLKLTLDRS